MKKPCPICEGPSHEFEFNVFDDRYGYPGEFQLYECEICKHIFIGLEKPLDLVHLYTEFYPRKSLSIADYQTPSTNPNRLKTWLNGQTGAYSLVPKNVRVLDVGCGFGQSLGYHKARGCEVAGVEADANVQKVSDHFGLNIKVGEFKAGLFAEEQFDYVTMEQVLEHTINPLETMKIIHSLLKPGGRLVCTVPNAHGWGRRKFQKLWIHWHAPYHLHFFSMKSLQIAADKTGFKIQSTFTQTSSEWLFYQKLHVIYGANKDQPSIFWDSSRTRLKATKEQEEAADKVRRWHRRKWNHFLTRILDWLGQGDNLFVVFEKK